MKIAFWFFVVDFFILMWIGSQLAKKIAMATEPLKSKRDKSEVLS